MKEVENRRRTLHDSFKSVSVITGNKNKNVWWRRTLMEEEVQKIEISCVFFYY